MRNDGEDAPTIHVPSLSTGLGLRYRQRPLIESQDPSSQSVSVEEELRDRIRRSAALRYSLFDCNICWDVASDPVLTSCGHLFCWSCLYRWLHVDSDAHECPVCKGEVTETNLTPIYGRGSGEVERKEWELELGLTVPPRPHAQRIESFRQSLYGRTSPLASRGLEESIRRRVNSMRRWIRTSRRMQGLRGEDSEETTQLGRSGVLQDEGSGGPGSAVGRISGRASLLQEWIRSIRTGHHVTGLHRDDSEEVAGSARSGVVQDEDNGGPGGSVGGRRDLFQEWYNLIRPQRSVEVPELGRAASLVETLVQTLHDDPLGTDNGNQSLDFGVEQRFSENGSGEDRDSVSSNAAVVQSDNGILDSVAELDSLGSFSSLESRGRRRRRNNDTWRSLDADDGISPASRRRRVN